MGPHGRQRRVWQMGWRETGQKRVKKKGLKVGNGWPYNAMTSMDEINACAVDWISQAFGPIDPRRSQKRALDSQDQPKLV